ncbi:uncharacterized protein CCR75_003077 [Bremia lactucae]|uniref:FYVE-type domain-containing protein n=1 Tax=Bremia lactucae TaxID=4779 RepID=A0A976IJX7_BRELC|nr:hypothetical protein CCR75_003077 [Bremia lactucae]
MVSFPLSQRPFGRQELSENERRRFHSLATDLLGNALKKYEDFALIRHRQVDRRRWKPVKSHEDLTVFREWRSSAIRRSSIAGDKDPVQCAAMAPVSSSGPQRFSGSSFTSGGSLACSIETKPALKAIELELLSGWGLTATKARDRKKVLKNSLVGTRLDENDFETFLGVGKIIGSLDDVMYGVAASDCSSMAVKIANLHEDVLDGDILSCIEGPSQRSPFRFLGLKWLIKSMAGAAIKHKLASTRDIVYLEATGVITRGDSVRIGYHIMHSVDLPGCPELYDSHGVIRAQCESVYLFVELNSNTVDVYFTSNVVPNGKISASTVVQSCATALLYCGKSVQFSQDKKLMWQLICRSSYQNLNKEKPACCSICNKTFGRFRRQSMECELCWAAICSKCCVERLIKRVDTTGDKQHVSMVVLTSMIELCVCCNATNMESSALTIAREEVKTGHFGFISSGGIPKATMGMRNTSSLRKLHSPQTDGNCGGRHRFQNNSSKHVLRSSSDSTQKHLSSPQPESSNALLKRRSCHEFTPGERDFPAEALTLESLTHCQRSVHKDGVACHIFSKESRDDHNNMELVKYGSSVDLCDLNDSSVCSLGKESIRKTTSSSDTSFDSIHLTGMSPVRMGIQELEDIRQSFDSFGDLLDIHDEDFDAFDDVDETLDTRDMEIIKRTYPLNNELWRQIAELRDAAEDIYQYTKESTAKHITSGGFLRRHTRLQSF